VQRTLERAETSAGDGANPGVARLQFFTRYQAIFRTSEAMRHVEQMVVAASETTDAILIEGEPGAGKQTVARTIHYLSDRGKRPFVRLRVTAIPPDALESVLFGEEQGARRGLVEEANGGTLFIDEAFDVPPEIRQRLIALGADGHFVRRRSRDPRSSDVRLMWATTMDVRALVHGGAVSAAAVDALAVLRIAVPPLRERSAEIPALAEHFRHACSRRAGRIAPPLPADAMQMMREHAWPGNVGELENVVKRWVAFQDPAQLRQELAARLRPRTGAARASTTGAGLSLADIGRGAAREAERRALQETLDRVGWNRAAAARALKVSYKTLLQKLTETGLDNRPRGTDKP
jgi:DNA-binding NtrC family response regulator